MDMNDLYDHEIEKIPRIWKGLMDRFSKKANTRHNLEELSKSASEEFLKIGLVVEVNTAPCLIIDANTGQAGSPIIEIMGRVPGSHYQEEGVVLFDHERKRDEVLKSKERGEDYLGQKGK